MRNANIGKIGKVTTHRIVEGSAETNLILMLDAMGKRYGKLPSELFQNADTFDLMVMDVAFSYEHYINNKNNSEALPSHQLYDKEDLENRLKKARNEI